MTPNLTTAGLLGLTAESAFSEVREIELEIETTEYGRQRVRGWELTRALPGLVLHRQFMRETRWRVSHVASGRCLHENLTFATAVEATQFMAWLVQGAPLPPRGTVLAVDWTAGMVVLEAKHPRLRDEITKRAALWCDRQRKREARRRARVVDKVGAA